MSQEQGDGQIGAEAQEEKAANNHGLDEAVRSTVGLSPCISLFQLPLIDCACFAHMSPIPSQRQKTHI